MSKPNLSLKLKAVRKLQDKHGIKNLLNLGDDLANISPDFLGDLYYEGTRHLEKPPTMEEIEDIDLRDLMDALKDYLGAEPGKSETA
jgi:hypothetical protein